MLENLKLKVYCAIIAASSKKCLRFAQIVRESASNNSAWE
ncbi:MAG: hypothetical protein ACD_28C00028G0001, partial [uncultured bacterium]